MACVVPLLTNLIEDRGIHIPSPRKLEKKTSVSLSCIKDHVHAMVESLVTDLCFQSP